MNIHYLTITILLLIHQTLSDSTDSEFTVQMCDRKEPVKVQISTKRENYGVTCQCQADKTSDNQVKEGYSHTKGIGSYKLHKDAKTWDEARSICLQEGAHLAIINSEAEEAILVEMLKRADGTIRNGLNQEEALLGIHDLYQEGEWITLFGESLYTTGYSHWSRTYYGGQPDNFQNRQNCGAIINIGGMDDVDCRDKFAFFCELPLSC